MGIIFNDGINFVVKNCHIYGGSFDEGSNPRPTFEPGDVANLPPHLADDLVLANGWLELTRQGGKEVRRADRKEDRREDMKEFITGDKDEKGDKESGRKPGPGPLTGR
jgi:hypothetical protein